MKIGRKKIIDGQVCHYRGPAGRDPNGELLGDFVVAATKQVIRWPIVSRRRKPGKRQQKFSIELDEKSRLAKQCGLKLSDLDDMTD